MKYIRDIRKGYIMNTFKHLVPHCTKVTRIYEDEEYFYGDCLFPIAKNGQNQARFGKLGTFKYKKTGKPVLS